MANEDRFVKIHGEGFVNVTEIWVDKKTGVNYLFHASGNSGGLTVLLNRDGTPVITPIGTRLEE